MSATKKTTTAKKKTTAAPKKKAAAASPPRRADFGAPVDAFFAKQTGEMKLLLDTLRAMVEKALPKAEASLKWGMPFYSMNGKPAVALGSHKAHVNVILSGAPGTFPDPKGLLEGEGKTGQHLKLTSVKDLPKKEVEGWLKILAKR